MLQPDAALSLRVWMRHAIAWTRFYRTSILLNFTEPLIILVALGFGLGSYVHRVSGMSFVQFIGPGLLAVTAMNSTSFDSLFATYNFLHENRVYPSMITSPLTVDDLVAGTLLWQGTRSLVFGASFLVVLAVFGLVHSPLALLVLPVLFTTGIMFAAPAMAYASISKVFEHNFYYIGLLITPMFMFSGVFFPPSRLPHGVQVAIWFTPLYHVAHLSRGLVLGSVSGDMGIDVLWMGAFTALMLLLPARLIARKLLV